MASDLNFSSSFSVSEPTFSIGANIKGIVGPRFKLLLYGVVGPRADIGAFGELDVDILRTPIWKIFGGLEANAGIRLQIFDHTIADQEFPLIIQFRRLLAEGGVAGNGVITGSVRDAITRQPLPNSIVAVHRDGDLIDSLLTNGAGQFSLSAIVGAVYRFRSLIRDICLSLTIMFPSYRMRLRPWMSSCRWTLNMPVRAMFPDL